MGSAQVCGGGCERPCGGGAAEDAAPEEFQPGRGATSDEPDAGPGRGPLDRDGAPSPGGPGPPPLKLSAALLNARRRRLAGGEEEPFPDGDGGIERECGEGAVEDPARAQAERKKAAMTELVTALDVASAGPSASSARLVEAALQRAEEASIQEQELREYRRRADELAVVRRMDEAAAKSDIPALNEALEEAQRLRVPQADIARALSVMEARRTKEEEAKSLSERQAKQRRAADELRIALAVRRDPRAPREVKQQDLQAIQSAIDRAERAGVDEAAVAKAREALADLQEQQDKAAASCCLRGRAAPAPRPPPRS